MLIAAAAVLTGLVLLVWSADRFVDGASDTARHLGVSPLIIGMVIIGFGTSAPEMTVSALAAWQGNPGVALGNAVGSNITNIALIIGITAAISPIRVRSSLIRREFPVLIGITAVTVLLLSDGDLARADGVLLLLLFAGVMGWMIRSALQQRHDLLARDLEREAREDILQPLPAALGWLLLGLVLLITSSRVLVWGAVEIATALGVSDLIIGLTVIAIGTSLPELASSIAAARRQEHDLALGNIIGSNLFNTLAVIGIAGSIHPLPLETGLLVRDLPVMVAVTLVLLAFCWHRYGSGHIWRWQGILLVVSWVLYTLWLMLSAAQSMLH